METHAMNNFIGALQKAWRLIIASLLMCVLSPQYAAALTINVVGQNNEPVTGFRWLDRMRLVYPFELTERRAQRLSRMNHWLEARKIPLLDERIQSSTYFALTVAGDALSSMGDNFSRDYFIERIEQMTEQSPASAVYPRLSLGPGQRFASRGGYVARFPGAGENMLMPVSEWIVP